MQVSIKRKILQSMAIFLAIFSVVIFYFVNLKQMLHCYLQNIWIQPIYYQHFLYNKTILVFNTRLIFL